MELRIYNCLRSFFSACLMGLTAPRNVAYPSALERLLLAAYKYFPEQGYIYRVAAVSKFACSYVGDQVLRFFES